MRGARHFVLPDVQQRPGYKLEHMGWAGEYAVSMRPDVIICIGDFWDFHSLSSYDRGKGSHEGARYLADIKAGNEAMHEFMKPILEEQRRLRKNKKHVWRPRLIFTAGNHEYRIDRAINEDPRLEGLMSLDDTCLKDYGWEVYPFLEVVQVDGVCYSHYFTSGVMGRPCSSARLMLTKKHMSCVMGHVQDREIAYARRADGTSMTGLFVGVYNQHDEDYLNPQTNQSWRGVWVLHDVQDGAFDEMPVSLDYLREKYK